MPRTKQIHPRNLRDKIEEAQKELNGAEVSKKEILEAGIKGTSESLKGIKRKKIVAENHLKKIPKSPLRNPLRAKHKQNTDESSFAVLQNAPESHKKQNHSPVRNRKSFAKQNGETPGVVAEASKSEESVSPKKPSFLQHPSELRRWRSEGSDPTKLSFLDGQCESSSLSSRTRTDHSECISSNYSPASSSYTNTAFDVLLKAMEPELSTLSQRGSSCAVQIEKLRPNKTAQSPSQLKNSSVGAPNQTSQELVSESQSPYTSAPVHTSPSWKNGRASLQPASPPYSQHEYVVSKSHQQNQQLPVYSGFARSLTSLHSQESPRLEQLYHVAVTTSVGLTSPSGRTQVTPQNQQMDSALPVSVSAAQSALSSTTPAYNPPPVASVVSHSAEQMCSLLLKEQKPKKQGKYVCEYCSRACAKPSVLLKHIRSHTGERPYPCVTCGFSFKTKSNLYKHKKSHAHTIKLGLVLQPDTGGLFLAHESPKALSIHSDVEDSGESDDESTADERQRDSGSVDLQPMQIMKMVPSSEAVPKSASIPSNPDHAVGDVTRQDRSSESQAVTELPKVVVHPVSVPSPLRVNSPKSTESKPELPSAQKQKDLQGTGVPSQAAQTPPLETEEKSRQRGDTSQPEAKPESPAGIVHAQLQRQQATDHSQEQQGKLLSPRSLGSTDSGYFSRSESADQTVSPPAPFARTSPATEPDSSKNSGPSAPRVSTPAPSASPAGDKALLPLGQMRPPLATKTLEERISKLISDNEALVDDKQLDSVKPRRTSLSRRGSIDSPKSYIFKDSFQFDLKPMGRRTSSSSDIPKSPFTPTEKSKQVFLLSVPSLDCLPITRSNSVPTTGYSAVPANVIPPPHPLRGSQSFDDKIGAFYDDVFVSGPNASVPQSGHPRTLVRQTAVEDSSASEAHALGAGQSLEESYQGCSATGEAGMARSRPLVPGSHLEKKKSHQGRGTMFECETCRNRYRKLENFENHKKFYCSELHGPKTKAAVREPEHGPAPGSTQPQVLHYRVAGAAGAWEQTSQIRKRRKMKSVGDDDEVQQNESGASPKSSEGLLFQNTLGSSASLPKHVVIPSDQQRPGTQLHSSQIHLVAGGPAQVVDPKLSTIVEQQMSAAAQDQRESQRHGAGISVIQHTNSLSRPSSLDKLVSFERGCPVSLQELSRTGKLGSLKVIGMSQEEGHPSQGLAHPQQPAPSDALRTELQEGSRKVAGERHVLGQPSRLVRQHNIQVPEILVTEEPDRDLASQVPDPEKSEKFSWPQRSEMLSKLPTEKLPPKKKRLRLAEMEHSSAESSFDSTLSRSLSKESSLSHTSSFSASLDIEDVCKMEAPSQIAFLNKTEFLVIPAGSHTLSMPGPHREMRRAASEQINCMQASMEVSDFRSKSFDCGSMTPPQTLPLADLQPPTSPSGVGVPGHVPLLERRRGPLVRQISLNIAPDSHLSPGNPSSFHAIAVPGANAVAFPGPPLANSFLAEFPANNTCSQTHGKDLQTETSSASTASLFPVQRLFGINLLNQIHVPLSHQNTQLSLQVSTWSGKPDADPSVCVSSESEDRFAPKYQLQCQAFASSQSCSSNPAHSSPKQVLSDPVGTGCCVSPLVFPTKLVDAISNSHTQPALRLEPLSGQVQKAPTTFTLPGCLQSNAPGYSFAAVTPLPQILVTQDLSSQSICQATCSVVPISEEQNSLPELQKVPPKAAPNSEEAPICKNVFSEVGQNSLSDSLPGTQKMSVVRLSPQESSASSKRMLSPANSLDIAMEKHQKRAKDENGAICAADAGPFEPLSSRANEVNKHKKPILVRQVCTTEPLESGTLEQDSFSQPEISREDVSLTDVLPADNLSSGQSKSVATEPIKESGEFEDIKSSALQTLIVRNSPVPSENTHVSSLECVDSNQERESPEVKDQGDKGNNTQEQSQPPTATPAGSEAGDPQQRPFPSLKTTTSFTWCYLFRQRALHLPQNDQRTSAYTDWTINVSNPNPLGLPTKVALSLLNSKQKTGKSLYCQAITTCSKSDLLVYSSKWKSNLSKRALGNQKSTVVEFSNKDASEINSEQDKENSLIKSEPRRIKIFDGGYKSNEEYVYVRGRGRGKYICEECGIRCKKPSMLKKHIRTHTDVRPYHCTYCNFSFKTKGNLTKHMKSKTHSKKCVDLGVSVGLIDEQDTEESDDRQRCSFERLGYDLEDSDGVDEDDIENEDDDEDSQAESVLSAAPSAAASPQHLPSRSSLQDPMGADEDSGRVTDCFSELHTDLMDILPRALPTKMTVLSAVRSDDRGKEAAPVRAGRHAARDEGETGVPTEASGPPGAARSSPCHRMSVDGPESEEILRPSVAGKAIALTQSASPTRLRAAPERGPHTAAAPQRDLPEQQQIALPPAPGPPPPQTHLFSHLPLHSQQQSRTPYNMVPVGGIHVVPAGLTYSTFVPIPAGPVQLTIPAVNVIRRTVGTPGDTVTAVSGTTDPTGVAELSSVVPCIPIGQIHMPGLQSLSAPGLQPLPSLSMETVNILGLANANVAPQAHAPGLALNAVGLQVLAASPPARGGGAPQAQIPGLQIVNIALPTLIPSVSQVAVDAQGAPETPAAQGRVPEARPKPTSAASGPQGSRTASPQGSPGVQRESAKNVPDPPAPARDHARPDGTSKMDTGKAASANHVKPKHEPLSAQGQAARESEPLREAPPKGFPEQPGPRALPADRLVPRPKAPPRRPAAQFSDLSSDDDEDRLVIAT